GFFAKERFEVVVDVDDDDGPPAPVTELPAEFGLEATEDFCERLLSLADGVSDAESAPAPATMSTERPQFSAVLESITRHMEPDARPAPAAIPAAIPAGTASAAPAAPPAPVPAATGVDNRTLARLGLP